MASYKKTGNSKHALISPTRLQKPEIFLTADTARKLKVFQMLSSLDVGIAVGLKGQVVGIRVDEEQLRSVKTRIMTDFLSHEQADRNFVPTVFDDVLSVCLYVFCCMFVYGNACVRVVCL